MNSSVESSSAAIAEARPVRRAKNQSSLFTYRLMIVWRFALAMFGGYAIAMYSAILIAHMFSDHRASAAMSATLIAFSLQAGAFIWVFMVNKTLKASLGIIVPAVILFALAKVLGN